MSRAIVILVRIGLGFLGLLLLGGGIAGLAMGDVMHSEAPPVGPTVLRAIDIGSIGYGLLLLLPSRWLARAPWLAVTLTLFTGAFGLGIFFTGLQERSLLSTAFGVSVRLIPAAVALGLAAWEYRNLTRRCS